MAKLAPVRGQLGAPVAEPEGARAVGAKPARMAAAPAVHALAVPRAVVEAVVAAHVLACKTEGAVHAHALPAHDMATGTATAVGERGASTAARAPAGLSARAAREHREAAPTT